MMLGVALCLYLFRHGFYAVSWDESSRTLDAYSWLNDGVPRMPVWLPFYRVCVGSALKFYPDLFLTPRIVTCLFGLVAVPACARLAHELFQDRLTTLLTLVLSVALSQRIALSLAPLSEIMFIAAMLLTMAAFANWLRTGGRAALWASAVAAVAASTIRYEAWLFTGAMLLAGLASQRSIPKNRRGEIFLWAIALVAYPLWRVATQAADVNPIQITISDARQFSDREILWRNPLVQFVVANLLTLNLVGLAGVVAVARRGEWRYKVMLAVSFLPLFCASAGLLLFRIAESAAPWRMSCIWTMLLIPYTARFLTGDKWTAWAGAGGRALKLCAAGACIAAFLAHTSRLKQDNSWAFPQADLQAGQYLDSILHSRPATRILIESSLFFHLPLLVASQHPGAFIENSVPEQVLPPILAAGAPIRKIVQERKIHLLVFRSEQYKKSLDSNPEVALLDQFGPWSIYRVQE